MLNVKKFARRVAAVDENLLDECPESDKIWANHIGYALSLTFVVLFGVVFYSMTYIDGAQILFDPQSSSVKFESHPFSYVDYLKYALIAFIIALVIFLFDRAFYQSDWFLHAPYGEESTIWEKSKNIFSKFFRITVRLVISLSLAYALSIFLELKFYESELLSAMQKKHLNENKEHYDALTKYADTLDAEEEELKKEEIKLLEQIQNINSGVFSWAKDKVVNGFKSEKKEYAEKIKSNILVLEKELEQKIANLKLDRTPIEEQMKRLLSEYNEMGLLYQAEVGGVKEIKIGDKMIKATGIQKEGKIAKMYKKRKEQLKKGIDIEEKKLYEVNSMIKTIRQKHDQQIQTLEKDMIQQIDSINKAEKEYKQKVEENFQANAESIKERLKNTLQRVQKRLEDLLLNKEQYVKKYYQEVMQSPEFIPFRDGMMSRFIAFKELSKDPVYGDEISFFSWIVKGFLIFLEVIPVISKMLFGPPTVYATKLQMRAKRVTENFLENKGATINNLQEEIEIEKKKRELIEARWQTRLKASSHHVRDDELDDMLKQSVNAYASQQIA